MIQENMSKCLFQFYKNVKLLYRKGAVCSPPQPVVKEDSEDSEENKPNIDISNLVVKEDNEENKPKIDISNLPQAQAVVKEQNGEQ